ncbi:GerAB/ArcD/ProY family transporter [Paenibacillus sp. HB172176]|uniref:GerAB/ArcD/ProY family transporter n=1 Tax=Paenibacillus sp. HB172176 TaxID=2493690 RepID=UPI00143A5BA2|nr:GerAB/ArcD/ProY family transporter [Paenibacillus sp. HB172176]
MAKQLKAGLTVSPYLLWFLIHGTQTGVSTLNFQNRIIHDAEMDSWLSLLLVGVCCHLIASMMFYILKHAEEGDLISLHRQLFGVGVGWIMNFIIYAYILLFMMNEMMAYAEVLHVWVFLSSPMWMLLLIVLLPCIYIVSGGLRVITGICLLCVVLPSFLLLSLYYTVKQAHWTNLQPVFNHHGVEYVHSAFQSIPLFVGLQFLLFLYPFVKNNTKSQKWAHIAVFHSTFIYFIILIASFVYFNIEQLNHTVWPTLNLSKIIRFSFLERFEFVYIFEWYFVIMPPCCVALWSAVRVVKKTLAMKARPSLWLTCGLLFLCMLIAQQFLTVDRIRNWLTWSGGIFMFGYIPLLFLWVAAARWLRRRIDKRVRV